MDFSILVFTHSVNHLKQHLIIDFLAQFLGHDFEFFGSEVAQLLLVVLEEDVSKNGLGREMGEKRKKLSEIYVFLPNLIFGLFGGFFVGTHLHEVYKTEHTNLLVIVLGDNMETRLSLGGVAVFEQIFSDIHGVEESLAALVEGVENFLDLDDVLLAQAGLDVVLGVKGHHEVGVHR